MCFVNVVGGVRISETAADLPAVLATVSSVRDQPLARRMVCFGELGLAGEVRPVPYGEERLREAAKHGFERAIVPEANKPRREIEGLRGHRRRAPGRCVTQRLLSAVLDAQADRPHARGLHRVVGGLQNLDRQIAELQAGAGLRNRFQIFEDQAVQRARPVGGQSQPSVRFSTRMLIAPLITKLPSASRWMSLCSVARRAGELADDFFENVFERHQAADVAVLIDDQRDAPTVALEVQQLHV